MITPTETTQEIAQLKELFSATEQSLQGKEKRIRILEGYILSLQQKHFGSSSEKQDAIQAELVFTEAEAMADAELPTQEDAFKDDAIVVAEHKRVWLRKAWSSAKTSRVSHLFSLWQPGN